VCPKAADGVHQYFELRKLHNEPHQDKNVDTEWWFERYGILVKCTLCDRSRELWEE
jgi:hypothetical protein